MSRLIPSSDPFSDVFQAFLRPIRQRAEEDAPRMDIDITEGPDAYILKADAPGFSKEDIDVQIDGATVLIRAHREQQDEVKSEGRVIQRERYWGSAQRMLTLAGPIDEAQAKATYDNGVLTLNLPKKAGGASRKVAVE